MRKMTALFVTIAFSLAVAGFAVAQPKPATETGKAAAPGQEVKKEQMEKKVEKKVEKKAKETKADCLKMAKDDDAKAECEKKYAKAEKKPAKKAAKAEKKEAAAEKK